MSDQIAIPYKWRPYNHQLPFFEAMDAGYKRAVMVWHRRAGKDSASLNFTAMQAFKRKGVYWHMLPTATQARKVVWDGIDKKGRRVIDQVFPVPLREGINKQEMKIELKNGSIWQCVGSDNYDSLVGSNPVGVVFSEYSLADPSAWDYIRPILAENGGWAIFIYTPRGKNHGFTLYDMAKKNPTWYCQKLTVDETNVVTKETLEEERAAGMSEAMISQEFYCNFDIPVVGAYYAEQINRAYKDKRICRVPIEQSLPVYTFWDLGIADHMSIWFAQPFGQEIRLIHYYENNNEGMAHYINYLKDFARDNDIRYESHYAPHDIKVRELMSGKSRLDTAREMGVKFRVVKKHSIMDGIEAVRQLFPRFWIDEVRCGTGINAISSYCKEYDEKNQVFRDRPKHDYASHAADSLRQLAMSWSNAFGKSKNKQPAVMAANFNPYR